MSNQIVYIAEVGFKYQPTDKMQVFESKESASEWVKGVEPDEPYIEAFDWDRITKRKLHP